jgi:hypothetical protein
VSLPRKPTTELAFAVAEWQADLVDPDRLPDIACEALAQGFDGPAVRAVAGLLGRPASEIGAEVTPALRSAVARELHLPDRDHVRALRALVRVESARIVRGDVSPIEGARRIYHLFTLTHNTEVDWLGVGGLVDEWDRHSDEGRAIIDREIVEAAARLIDATPRARDS